MADLIYQLGYEVGYYNHSEIGWVLRDKSRLLNEAQKELIDCPEHYYNEGKTKGKLSRDNGVGEGKTENTIIPQVKVESPERDDKDDWKSPQLPRNKINELPKMVQKIHVTDMPEFLNGNKHLRKK